MPSYWQYLAIYIKACVLLCTFMLTVELFVSWWVSINSICRPVVISWVDEMTMLVCYGIKSIVPMAEFNLAFGLRTKKKSLNVSMLHVLHFCRGKSMVLLLVSFSLECSLGLIWFSFLTYLYTSLSMHEILQDDYLDINFLVLGSVAAECSRFYLNDQLFKDIVAWVFSNSHVYFILPCRFNLIGGRLFLWRKQ